MNWIFLEKDYIVDDKDMDEDFKELLRRELAGFKRRERLDVKKPGPLFLTNNFGFKTEPPPGKLEVTIFFFSSYYYK